MVGKVAIHHSADPHVYLLLDEGKVSRVAPGWRVMNSQRLLEDVTFSCLIGLIVPSGLVITISWGTMSGYVHSPSTHL